MMTFGMLLFVGLLLPGMNQEQFSSERQLLLFGIEKNTALMQRQLQLLSKESKGLNARSVIITVVQNGDARIKKYSIKPGQFTVLLIGKDSTEKYRTYDVLSVEQLFGIIDAMTMRKAGMESGIK